MEKASIVHEYRFFGLSLEKCLTISGLSKHQLYYKSKGPKVGRPISQVTKRKNLKTESIEIVPDGKVVEEICKIKQDPDMPNYYRLISIALALRGYYINHKKVYRLMKENQLLGKKAKPTGKSYVKHRRVIPTKPLEIIEMDIKYIWISEQRRYAYILTILDTFTRYVLCFKVGYSMKTDQVRSAWEFVIATYFEGVVNPDCQLQIEVRNDNGKQFSSAEIKEFFKENYLMQVFTHPYTPEENGHIESFHKTLGRALRDDYFETLQSAEDRLQQFYHNYNHKRPHGSTKVPPGKFWVLFEQNKVDHIIIERERKSQFRLKVDLQEIAQISHIKKYENWAIRA